MRITCLIPDKESANVSLCGRTDKGVSALGNVIACHLRSNLISGLGVMPPPPEPEIDTKQEQSGTMRAVRESKRRRFSPERATLRGFEEKYAV